MCAALKNPWPRCAGRSWTLVVAPALWVPDMQIGTTMHQSAERHGQRAKAGWFSRPRALQIAGCTALLCLPVVLTQTTTLSLMLWYNAVAAVSNFRIPLHVFCTSPVASHRSVPTCCYNARISAQTDTNRPTWQLLACMWKTCRAWLMGIPAETAPSASRPQRALRQRDHCMKASAHTCQQAGYCAVQIGFMVPTEKMK